MRKIAAKYIYTGKQVLKDAIIELSENGKIIDIKHNKGGITEQESLEYYNGVIVPGFVNAHCHLELSHMKGIIKSETVDGLPGFIDEIISKRDFPEDLQEKIFRADREMRMNGIVAVGDISNTDDTFKIKAQSDIYYHTFIEVFSINNKSAGKIFSNASENFKKSEDLNISCSIVPHAAYSVPSELRKLIREFNSGKNQILSVHNQETSSEDEMIKNKSGKLAEVLKKKGFVFEDLKFNSDTALKVNLSDVKKEDSVLLIHNTFSNKNDIEFAENFSENIYWVLCPLSNLYIEKTLPCVNLFLKKDLKVCLGTDSYTSNTKLSIFDEMKEILFNFPEISFKKTIEWACINGAKALKINNIYGSIEIGKRPGLNLISNFDFEKMSIKKESKVKVLV